MTDREVWKDIPRWPYQVSNKGRVRRSPSHLSPVSRDVMKPSLSDTGYLTVSLRSKGRRWSTHVHTLVATHFVGPRPSDEHEVNHKDANKTNNNPSNLEWVTRQENASHAAQVGAMLSGEDQPQAKLSNDEVAEIRRVYAAGLSSQGELAERYGVAQATISNVVAGNRYKEAPGPVVRDGNEHRPPSPQCRCCGRFMAHDMAGSAAECPACEVEQAGRETAR